MLNLKRVWQNLRSACSGNYISTKTGKPTRRTGFVQAFQEKRFLTMPLNEQKGVDYTLEDVAAMTIRCAWCGHPIFIGDPVTLYMPRANFSAPDWAVVYRHEPLTFVGCLRMDCAETGADRMGFWYPDPEHIGKGYVYRVPSPFEIMMANPGAGCIIMNDLTDPTSKPVIYKD